MDTPAPELVGPLFDALRKLSREQGTPLVRSWKTEARHVLLYVSQDAASTRTALYGESYNDVSLAVELTEMIGKLAYLRDAVYAAARETPWPRSTPPGYADCAVVTDRRGSTWIYSEPADVWKVCREENGYVSHPSSRSWQRLLHDFGPVRSS